MESEEYYEYLEEEAVEDQEQWEGGWGEIAVAPIFHGEHVDYPSALRFDAAEESLWAGTNQGFIAQSLCPDLERFAQVAAHEDGITAMRSAGSSCVALSPSRVSLHYSGCVPRVWYLDEIGDLAALEFEPRSHRVLLGRGGGGITSLDLVSGRPCGTIDTFGQGVVALSGPLPRGAVVMGTVDGKITLLDARNSFRQESSLLAHSGGFAALDASEDLIATAGYVGRMGRVTLEPTVKIFDVRMGVRMLANIPFAAGPTILRFNPSYPTTLLVASASGMFSLSDSTGIGAGEIYAVDTGGDALLSCDISPTGEVVAFGSAGGYVHLWAASEEPSASIGGEIPSLPQPPEEEPPSLSEEDSFGTLMQHYPSDNSGFASDIGPRETMSTGLAPRTVDQGLMATSKQVDFVAHIENPKLIRGGRPGQSAAAVAGLRNTRLKPRPEAGDAEEARAARAAARAAAGGVVLPGRYRRVSIKHQTGVKFEEFDFSYYNKTPFSGLENDLSNCYVNSLLQVLFFCRPMRDLAMTHVPNPDMEFSLMGELSLLFRMLATAGGMVCQATNLLRALRQSKEALALGLLEGVRGERGSGDIEVEAQKDKSLARRTQRLSRFLMEQLSKETAAAASGGGGGGRGGALKTSSSSASLSGGAGAQSTERSPVENVFAFTQRQRTRCLSRQRPEQLRATRAFQADLQYPSAKERPPFAQSTALYGTSSASALGGISTAAAAGGGGGTFSPTTPAAAAASNDTAGGGAFPNPRPSFAELLTSSLYTVQDMRAWFDEVVSYQMVRQERCPAELPQVLVVNCGMEDRGDLAWWQPVPVESSSDSSGGAGASGDPERKAKTKAWLPMAVAVTTYPDTWSVEVEEASSSAELQKKLENLGPLPDNAVRAVYELTAVISHVMDEDEAAEGGPDYEGHLVAHINVPATYYSAQQESPMASRASSAGPPSSSSPSLERQQKAASPPAGADDTATSGGGSGAGEEEEEPSSPVAGGTADAEPPSTPLGVPLSGAGAAGATTIRRSWLLFNDFHISNCLPEEVTEIYAGQKVPVLLFFTRAEEFATAAVEPPAPPTPVLTAQGFLQLCRSPPIQPNKSRLNRPTFLPLTPEELPRPGQLFSLDAEFVQYSPPERVVRRGIEIEARPPRLGLGRVSVIRGEGSATGVTCIDDYIRSVETVHDYLTRFSGLVPGDLDPGQSRHHLTTLRKAYLKLRYLVDVGVVFVGHGLKKDFRMLNIVVPPEQVVDTVDLFHSGRRRLSLRFLAAYLLGASIQSGTHDSVEDALAALKLYEMYRKLVEESKFDSTLSEMYDWGNAHGWDPTGWKAVPPHLAAKAQAKAEAQAQAQAKQQEAAAAVAARQVQQLQVQVLQQQLMQQQRRQQFAVALQQQLQQQQQQRQPQQRPGSGGGGSRGQPPPSWPQRPPGL